MTNRHDSSPVFFAAPGTPYFPRLRGGRPFLSPAKAEGMEHRAAHQSSVLPHSLLESAGRLSALHYGVLTTAPGRASLRAFRSRIVSQLLAGTPCGACQELAYYPGPKCPEGRAARRRSENAVMERREAPRALQKRVRQDGRLVRRSVFHPLGFSRGEKRPAPA